MSYMTVTCPWCGQTYTTGVVGRQMVGTGHTCEAHCPCQEHGCDRLGTFQTASGVGPDGYEGTRFVCGDHIGDDVLTACQPGVARV